MKKRPQKINKWLLWGVIILAVLLVLWLTLFLFWNAETAGVVMQTGEAMEKTAH